MRVLIVGAAGRDYHDFNTVFRGESSVEVVAFTQAPGQNLGEIGEVDRRYPSALAGEGYPDGIPIEPEARLEELVRAHDVDQVVFSYSDVSHDHVMHVASRALAAGADFRLVGPDEMMLSAGVPVLAVDAVRTGCGKSRTTGGFADALADRGHEVRIVREPMPYGDLAANRVRRFASREDLTDLTIEEREEYEQHVEAGHVVFAGVDYEAVLAAAEEEADVIVWDGGNNELPFFRPDLHVVLADPLRPGDEHHYHPGETNLRLADCVLLTKENSADPESIETVVENVHEYNPDADVYHADSVVTVPDADTDRLEGARVLAVEDGPSVTHGETDRGAAAVAAEKYGATRVDPREGAVGSIAETLDAYPHLDRVLPAMGYSESQMQDLEETVQNVDCEVVLAGTPHDLAGVIDVDVPIVQVAYDVDVHGWTFDDLLEEYADQLGL